ncbi:MAG: tRNA lysidine(34) synthetase TilS [Lachnospiraceae bacterium]|nr:tRNA lysidine(34) synthetase TilS [Lachnospiraceae bacterium]
MKAKQLTEEKVFAFMRKHHMLEPGERVVAGISGGADSVCLLFVLMEWAQRVPLQLAVVHVNHSIRPEAVQDAAYVETLCREHDLPFYLIEEDVRQQAAIHKCSEEDMGRRVRYEAFQRVAQEFGADKIAVAHNCNDCSETMLFHLFRGSGIKGLCGIRPVRENIIRPLLCLERVEIENYLQEQGISYCEDATNHSDDYTRNRIRHHILPYIEKEIVSGSVQHMAQTAEMLAETEDYLEQQTRAVIKKCTSAPAENVPEEARQQTCGESAVWSVSVNALLENHPAIQKRVLHTLLKNLSPNQRDISHVHVQALRGLFTGEGNREVHLPYGIHCRREYDTVVLERISAEKTQTAAADNQEKELTTLMQKMILQLPTEDTLRSNPRWERVILLEDGTEFHFSILQKEDTFSEIPRNEYTKWFDYDRIKGCMELRQRQTGDYLTFADGQGNIRRKSLKEYMISQKIPRKLRDCLPLLAEAEHVIWLPGYRISEYYKIRENTKHILQVQLIRKACTKVKTEEE